MIAFSPGLAQGCFELLGIASRNALTFREIASAFGQLGGMPSASVMETAQSLQWLRASEAGMAVLTPTGSRLVALAGYEAMLRQALIDYIDVVRPPWVQNAVFGRKKVIAFAGAQIGQVFIEAGLSEGTDNAIVTFWDALAGAARGQKNERLTEIGRRGERLTISHETSRTGRTPRWIALDNNEDGYDVLSIVDTACEVPLSIEVKASTMGPAASFHLTRHEWERAQEVEHHIFHLWDLRRDDRPALAKISPGMMSFHVPSDQGDGNWEGVRIPFGAFGKDAFADEMPGAQPI